jgi:hypothetical protein
MSANRGYIEQNRQDQNIVSWLLYTPRYTNT